LRVCVVGFAVNA
jgi:hypothetical protein